MSETPIKYEICSYCHYGFPEPISLHHDTKECDELIALSKENTDE